jgi:putative tryptophan/tyrosine transport system substrate-binding protein
MDRRAFLTGAAALCAAPLVAEAQPAGKVWRIGYLDPFPLTFGKPTLLEAALRERDWVEKRDYVFEARWADRKPERFTEFARELARLKVNVIVARGTEAATAASRATRDIPIVFADVADPVGAGLVVSLARPGANVTGLASVAGETAAKQLALLQETLPGLSLVEVLWVGMSQPDAPVWRELQASGQRLGIALRSTPIADQAGLQRALDALRQRPPGAALVYADEFAAGYLTTLGRFGGERRLPMASNALALTWYGGLMSYSRGQQEEWERTAEYVVRILKGARPAELPVQQPTKFELVINLGTAKALGLTIPPSLLLQADRVIE